MCLQQNLYSKKMKQKNAAFKNTNDLEALTLSKVNKSNYHPPSPQPESRRELCEAVNIYNLVKGFKMFCVLIG